MISVSSINPPPQGAFMRWQRPSVYLFVCLSVRLSIASAGHHQGCDGVPYVSSAVKKLPVKFMAAAGAYSWRPYTCHTCCQNIYNSWNVFSI